MVSSKTLKKYIGEVPHIFLLLSIGVFAARSLLFQGFVPTHDGEYHIIRLWQFDKMLAHGYLFPRWAPDLDFGYGVPLLMFYYPLPNYIGELFHVLGASYVYAVQLTLAVGLVVSGSSFYAFARNHFAPWPSFVGSTAYVLAPYHILDVLIRGSVGEVWALALAPLLFWGVHRFVAETREKYAASLGTLSLLVALTLLSHNLVGTFAALFSTGYGLLLILQAGRFRPSVVGRFLGAYALGGACVSFYYIPVLFESSFIRGLSSVAVEDHFPAVFQLLFPSWGSGFSVPGVGDTLSFQIGLVHLSCIAAAGALAILKRNTVALFFVSASIGTAAIMLEWSSWLWNAVPGLALIQYPWRLLSIVAIAGSWCVSYVCSFKSLIVVPIVFSALLLLYGGYTRAVVYDMREDSFYLSNPDWASGTATVGNTFTTVGAVPKQEKAGKATILTGDGDVFLSKIDPARYALNVNLKSDSDILVPVNSFPGWYASIHGSPVPLGEKEGMILVQAPAGAHSIIVEFADTPVRRISAILSTAAVITTLYLVAKPTYERLYT